MKNLLIDLYRYGCKLYPYLFQISLIVCSLNFVNLITGRFNNWNIIALICYTFFFGGIIISYFIKLYQENKRINILQTYFENDRNIKI